MPLSVEVVSAEKSEWSGEADMVMARSVSGELGIMPGHTPLLAVLAAGEVRIRSGQGDTTLDVDGGFMSVDHDNVVIVVEELESDDDDRASNDEASN